MRVQHEGTDIGDREGIAVWPGAQHLLYRDIAAGTAAIFDRHWLTDGAGEGGLQHAGGEIGLAARREANDPADRTFRPIAGAARRLGAGEAGKGKCAAGDKAERGAPIQRSGMRHVLDLSFPRWTVDPTIQR